MGMLCQRTRLPAPLAYLCLLCIAHPSLCFSGNDPSDFTDAKDREYNVVGSSYFRPLWYYDMSATTGKWFQNDYSVSATRIIGTGASESLEPANGYLTFTTASSVQNGAMVIGQDLLSVADGGTGDNIRFKMKLKLGDTNRQNSQAGSGIGVRSDSLCTHSRVKSPLTL